jgi:hypothetical protein
MTTWIQSLLGFFYDILFGCRHWSQTRPFTLEQQTYKVCLDCGKQIYYSTERMTPLSAQEVRRMKATTAGAVALIGTFLCRDHPTLKSNRDSLHVVKDVMFPSVLKG